MRTMYYLVYILAAFGIFSILVILIKLFVWTLNCDIKKQFIPIGESEVYTKCSNSMINTNEALDEIDKMLEQVIIKI